MIMIRTTCFALALLSASSFEIVSQTFNGNLTMKYSTPSVPSPTLATVEFGLDMQSVRFRQNEHMVMDMPQYNITTTTKTSSICDALSKRCTMYVDTEMKSPNPMPKTPPTCQYVEFPTLPDPATVAKCMQDVAALAEPVSSEDGLQKFAMHIPVPQDNASADEVIYTDKSFIVKKVIVDVSVTGAHPMTIHEEIIDMNSKAGAPDSSKFDVPAEWGTCKKMAVPPLPTFNNPVLKSFLHCMGMGASQPSLVV